MERGEGEGQRRERERERERERKREREGEREREREVLAYPVLPLLLVRERECGGREGCGKEGGWGGVKETGE